MFGGAISPWHLLFVAVIALLVFGGRGKLSSIMGDAAKGIRAFKDGLNEEPAKTETPPPTGAIPSETTLERQAADKK